MPVVVTENTPRQARGQAAGRGKATSKRKAKETETNPYVIELQPLTPSLRKEQAKRRRRLGFTVAATLVGLTGLFALAKTAIDETVIKNPSFMLKCMKVDSQGTLLPLAALEKAAEVPQGSNLLLLDLSHVKARLERLPAVAKADVSRDYEGHLHLQVQQRQPIAWVQCDAQHYAPRRPGGGLLVDALGTAIPMDIIPSEFNELPVIRYEGLGHMQAGEVIQDEKFQSALQLISALQQRRVDLAQVTLQKKFAMDAELRSGMRVTFAWDDLQAELPRFDRVMQWAAKQKYKLASLSVVNERNLAITLQKEPEGQVKALPVAISSTTNQPVTATRSAPKVSVSKSTKISKTTNCSSSVSSRSGAKAVTSVTTQKTNCVSKKRISRNN
jgi:cell division septal protein FtsQ